MRSGALKSFSSSASSSSSAYLLDDSEYEGELMSLSFRMSIGFFFFESAILTLCAIPEVLTVSLSRETRDISVAAFK